MSAFTNSTSANSVSVTSAPASQFQDLILRYWEVENCLHLKKEREHEEDKHRREGQRLGADMDTVLTNIIVYHCRIAVPTVVAGRTNPPRNSRTLPGKSTQNRKDSRLRMTGTCGTWGRTAPPNLA